MKYLSKATKILIIISLLMLIVGCSPATKDDVIKVGGVFALTGFGSGWGEVERNAAMLAVEEINAAGGINGKEVKLIVEDFSSESTKVVSAVTKLIEVDNVDVILGPTWLATFGGAAALADDHKIIMMTPSDSITAIKELKDYDYVFSTWYRTDAEAHALFEHLQSTGKKKVILFFGNDPFWQDVVRQFKQSIEGSDVDIIDEYKLNSGEVDFRTHLIKMKEANPDVIIFGLNDEVGVHAFLKQRAELDSYSAMLYTTEMIEEYASKDSFNGLLERVSFVAPEALESEFSKRYEERFDSKPLFSASNAYDTMHILAQALSETSSSEEMRNYLLTQEFDTVTFGKVGFDELGGTSGGSFVIKHIVDGEVVLEK